MAAAATIGGSLRAVRERRGWGREELAYRSGVSFSAIAQIEAGRRTDIRLSSLSALATALGTSLNKLAGVPLPAEGSLEHQVLAYGSDDELVQATAPFMAEGAERSEAVLAVTTEPRLALLRDALGEQAAGVTFAESGSWYASPQAALARYRSFIDERAAAGVPWTRIVGEPVWQGRSPAETLTWTRYESLINVVFASAEVTLICPYDTRTVAGEVVADAHRTHPDAVDGEVTRANEQYRTPEEFLL
jgi:transcriptional regulator with XRE-family HTH domain